MTPIRFQVNKRVEQALRQGHPWVYRGQCSSALDAIPTGSLVRLMGTQNTFLGIGLYDPLSAIAIRVISFEDTIINEKFLMDRLLLAWRRREKSLKKIAADGFRWVHGEADSLPGVNIDVYDKTAVAQYYLPSLQYILTGPLVMAAKELGIKSVWLKSPHSGPEPALQKIHGSAAALREPLEFHESGRTWLSFPVTGMKTGFFLDLRSLRFALPSLTPHQGQVLNLFACDGALSALCLESGAKRVVSVEQSPVAENHARLLFKKWKLPFAATDWICTDVWDWLKSTQQTLARSFDLVIVDPPLLATSQSQLPVVQRSWWHLHKLTLTLMKKNSILISVSCTERITEGLQTEWTMSAAKAAQRRIKLLRKLPGNFDHPVLPILKERDYLHILIWRVD